MRRKTLRAVSWVALLAGLATSAAWAQIPGLKNQDVGLNNPIPGSTTYVDGKYRITGNGNDIWGNADSFHYAYITVTGDFDYKVNVESLLRDSTNAADDGWSKAELMAREAEDWGAGLEPDGGDRFIAVMTTRSDGQNEVGLQWRSALRGSGCAWPNDIGIGTPVYRPTYPNTWLRLERIGEKFWAYASTDGVAWTLLRGSPYDFAGLNGNETTPREPASMASKLLLGMAVTSHQVADTSTAVFSGWAQVTPVPIAITTQPPAVLNVAANSTLTITAAATGDPLHFQWQLEGVDIPGATSATYTKPLCQTTDSGTYTLKCYASGQTVTSTACEVTVTVDTTLPTITSVKPLGQTSLRITFSEPVADPSATTTANYQLSPATAVTAAALAADGFSVTLTTASQTLNTKYTLTVNNVKDTAGNSIAPGTTALFTSVMLLKGFAYYERWDDASGDMGDINAFGTALDDGSARPPDVSSIVNQFGAPWGAADNYNARVRTFFTAPSNGNYVFFVSSDDASRVFLSTDDKPANKKLICQEPGWANQYQWTYQFNDPLNLMPDKRSDQFALTEWETWNTITLQANKTYYMEVRLNEGGGGDGVDVTFIKEGEADPTTDAAGMKLKGDVISWYESADVLPPVITSPTAIAAVTIDAGGTATLSVVATNPGSDTLTYQWQRDGVNLAGATSADYVITGAEPDDIGQYWCRVSNKNATLQSQSFFVLVKATGVFAIEAEDFDYDRGQSKPEASVMPYLGGAYAGLSAVHGVDYNNDDAPANNYVNVDGIDGYLNPPDHPVYRYGGDLDVAADAAATPPIPNKNATIAVEQPGGQYSITRAGEWEMTANYKVGWVGSGNWGNYTRTFPTPAKQYNVFAASSADNHAAGRLTGNVGLVTAGVGTATQTVQPLAAYNAPGTGAWSRNSLVGMREADGQLTKVELGGKQTIRWNYNGGDAEYLLFIPVSGGPGQPVIDSVVKNANGSITITWTGGGTLQAAEAVTGPWQDVTGATSPYTFTPTAAMLYGRIRQ